MGDAEADNIIKGRPYQRKVIPLARYEQIKNKIVTNKKYGRGLCLLYSEHSVIWQGDDGAGYCIIWSLARRLVGNTKLNQLYCGVIPQSTPFTCPLSPHCLTPAAFLPCL